MNLAPLTQCLVDEQKMDCANLVRLMKMRRPSAALLEVKDKVATTARAGLTLPDAANMGPAQPASLPHESRS